MGGSAWVTLATNDSYSLGALVLAHSLKQAGTVHQLAVLITPGVTRAMREKLETVFDVVKEVNVLDSRDEANLRLLKRPELGVTFTKLHCWTLTQFDKCVFLDADTLVLQNSDELFERDEFSAAPDVGWPDCFNSGVFVYRPSMQTYESLIQFALERGSFDGGDQGLLNLYFSDWAHKDISKHLPFIYNMCSTACYSYLPAFKQFGSNAKIMHFIGSQKPWLQYFNTETRRVQPSGDSAHLEGVLQRWWDIFCSLIHPHLSPAMQGQSQHGMSTSYIPPRYDPPPNPTASADDCESAWDPWDEYDRKIAQNMQKNIESLNTNTSRVANQSTVQNQPQSQNYNTYPNQSNSFYQSSTHYEHFSKVPTPPPASVPPRHRSPTPPPPPPPRHHSPTPPPSPHYYSPTHQQDYHPQISFHQDHKVPHQEVHRDNHHYHDIAPKDVYHHHDQHDQPYSEQYHESHHEDNPPDENLRPCSPEKSKTPPPSHDHTPVLPTECQTTTTASNEISVSDTIEDSNDHDDAGLAGAFSQLTLGVARTVEQDALENLLRKQAWEVGNIDYLGKDSFDNIWSKITETLSSGPAQAAVPAPEEAPSAPAESQSQTVPQQEAQSPAIENIESSLIDAEVKAPEADKPAQTCSIATKPDIVQEPIACPSVPPEQPAAPKTESPAEVKPETPQPAAVEETSKQPPQEAVAPTPLTEQPPAPLITPLQPKEETAQETVVSKEQPQQVPTEIIKAVPVTPETPKAEQSPVPAEQPNKEQLAPPEDPILATPPIAAPPQSCELKPVEAVKGDKPASEAPAQPAQPEVQVAKPDEVASAPAPAEPILPEVKAVRQEKPAEIVTEPVAPKVEAVKQDKSAEVVSAQAPAELIAPKVEPVKQEKPVSQAKPSEVEAAKQGKPVEVVSTPQAPVEAVAPVVEVGKQEKAAASGAQAQGVAAPSKESKDAPTPPPRKTDKPKKGASKSKK